MTTNPPAHKVDWLFSAKQHAIWSDDTTRKLLFTGGTGSGKTLVLSRWVIRKSKQAAAMGVCKRTAGLIVGKTYADLTNPILEGPSGLLTQLEDAGIRYHHHGTKHYVDILGFRWWCRGADKPDQIAGPDVSLLAADEAALMSAAVYKRMVQRVRNSAMFNQMLFTTTPEGTGTWVEKKLVQPAEEAERQGKPRTIHVERQSLLENLWTSEDYKRDMLETYADDPAGYRQYVEGYAAALAGGIYPEFTSACEKECFDRRAGIIVTGWDFNVRWMPTLLGTYSHRQNRLHIWGEVVNPEKRLRGIAPARTDDQAAQVAQLLLRDGLATHLSGASRRGLFDSMGERVRAYVDRSGDSLKTAAHNTDVALIHAAGFSIGNPAGANPPVRDRIAAVRLALKRGQLVIDPKGCPELCRALREHDRDKHGDPRKDWRQDEFQADHYCDALGYMVWNLIPISSRRP